VAQEPHSDEVETALGRLRGWPGLARSPQLAQFLDYIVKRTLAGEAAAIKAYSIAVDVFGRPADFDPQADPIVRVQARRLRALLEQYYAGDGLAEPVRIRLPVGRYVPEFSLQAPQPAALPPSGAGVVPLPVPPRGQVTVSWFTLAAIALGLLALAYSLSTWGPRQERVEALADVAGRPALVVMEFENLTGSAEAVSVTAGLALELVTDLEHFETMSVGYGGSRGTRGAGAAPADFVLNGIVRREDERLQYSAILTATARNEVVWSRTVSLTPAEAARPDVLDYVSGILSRVLGSSRGPLHARGRALAASGAAVTGHETLYACRMLFDLYRDSGAYEVAGRARACFAGLGARARGNGPALAAMASLTAEMAGEASASPARARTARLARADEWLDAAEALSPVSSFVWEQRARLAEARGQHETAEAAYSSALQLNPANLDAVAARARHLAFLGRLDEAAALARTAIEGAPEPPPWYLAAPTLKRLAAEDYAAALEDAVLYARADHELGPILAVMAARGEGDGETVSRYLPQVLDVPGFRAFGIMPPLRWRIADPVLLGAIRQSLLDAGVPAAAMDGAF